MASSDKFDEEYKKLNPAQKDAVESIDGPVMVVAGPGTGKTQILALRIANILQKTDIKADGILCLTFTNSAVNAMRERLVRYIGEAGEKVNVFTFHGFGMKIIEEHFAVLGLKKAPKLLEDTDQAIFFDQILNENSWEYLRPRGNPMRYFQDMKSLISLLKRECITFKEFSESINQEVEDLSESKLKKDAKKTESLARTREVVEFMDIYEKTKKEKNVLDYDDVLEYLVKIVEKSEEAASSIRERYLYVLIDEHQDSSRVQNEFLNQIWAEIDRPDIFVVGDDRQLIYGFSGASIEHFAGFKETFKDAKLITLVDNYRSTQVILDASHALLQSVMSEKKLISQNKEKHLIKLIEANTPEEEIISCALDIKFKISAGGGSALDGEKSLNLNDCAVLVPKNRQVRRALEILHGHGVPVSTSEALNLFDQEEAHAFLRVLKIIDNGDAVSLALSFFDKTSDVKPLEAHVYFAEHSEGESVKKWKLKIANWTKNKEEVDILSLIQKVGVELLEDKKREEKLVSGKEILDTILELLRKQQEKNPDITLSQFISYLNKLESYEEHIPVLADSKEGVKVLTMHSSKGLEFDYVWIAHMDEGSLAGGKKMGLTLPESIAEKIEERDIDAIKRKLYVAITRAKRFCTLSYSLESHKGGEQELAKIIADLPEEVFQREKAKVEKKVKEKKPDLSDLVKLAENKYTDRNISAWLLNNFFECPWKWYFQNILQLPGEKTETLEFGGKVHEAIDRILKSNKVILPEDKEVAKVVSAWAERRLKDIAPNRENEQSVSLNDKKFPHLKIYGKIDLIEVLDKDNVRVTDFKTGSVRKKGEIEKMTEDPAEGGTSVRMSNYLRQLAMYSYLIEQSPKWKVKVKESRLEFLEAKNEKERFYDTFIDQGKIDLLIKDIADYDHLVKNGEWINRPCNYNSYGKNTECEYCKMAEIYKS